MGILNITPDSFYDGNPSLNEDFFIKSLDDLTNADIIDIGCESSRPGADPINDDEEIRRLEIILPYITSMKNIKLSIDTYKPNVAKYALLNGFSIINDIKAGAESLEMFEVASSSKSQIILMHMKGVPLTMQNNPHYDNIIDEISSFLEYRAAEAVKYGISEENIISIEDCTKIFNEISISDNEYADLKNYGKTRSKIKKSGYFRGYNNDNFVGILSYSKDHLVKEILV